MTRERFQRAGSDSGALEWLRSNFAKLQMLFSTPLLRDFIFEPFQGIFDVEGTPTEREVRSTIAGTALACAVITALPGKLGVGLTVAIALEIYMAFRIARHLGYNLSSFEEARDSLGAAAATALTVFVIFKEVLGFFFSLFNLVGALPATFLAEYATVTFIGVVLWLGFEAGKDRGRFRAPKRLLLRAVGITRGILKHHVQILRGALSPANIRMVGSRIRAFLSGDVALDKSAMRGEVFIPVAMAYLLMKEAERLDGPLGQMFMDSVRQAWPDLEHASVDEIADHFRAYDAEELQGAMSLIKGQLFERMVEAAENADDDGWYAELHEDRTVPGSDMLMTEELTGDIRLVSIKATMSTAYIEEAIMKYPDVSIYATDEVAMAFEHTGIVHATGITHAELVDVTDENYDELLWQLPSHEQVIGGGGLAAGFVSLYPFLIAHLRGTIDRPRLEAAVVRVTGKTTKHVLSRLIFAAALGPVFGWYLLARGAMMASATLDGMAEGERAEPVRRIVFDPGRTVSRA